MAMMKRTFIYQGGVGGDGPSLCRNNFTNALRSQSFEREKKKVQRRMLGKSMSLQVIKIA